MTQRYTGLSGALLVILASSALPALATGQTPQPGEPIRRTLPFNNTLREYFVHLPPSFDPGKSYWPLVVVHGGGGNGRTGFPITGITRLVADLALDAIVISPSFPNDDNNASRFPALREGAYLEEVLKELRKEYRLKAKMLLTGYSRGGQFAHRFALAHPEQVEAVAPLAAGTWTTPDGRFLVQGLGEVREVRVFFSDSGNASRVPANLRDLFDPRVATVAESKAVAGAREVPYLVMCGTVDPRLAIAKEFARSLETLGYTVEAEWPRTLHSCADAGCRTEYGSEFEKYSRRTVEFFQRIVRGR